MAERLNKRHQGFVREKIRASQLINRLENHALKDEELSASQIKAIDCLLRKCIPDLSSVEMQHSGGLELSNDQLETRLAQLLGKAGIADAAGGKGKKAGKK